MKHDRRQMPREAVDLNNIDDDAQGTAPQKQNRFRIALDRTAAGVLLRWLTCLLLFCVLCLAALFLPVAEGFVRLLHALAAFPAMLPLLRDAGIGALTLTALLQAAAWPESSSAGSGKATVWTGCWTALSPFCGSLISIRSIKTSSSRSQTKASRSPNLLPRRKKRMPFLPT